MPLENSAVGHAPASEIVRAELIEHSTPPRPRTRRRVLLPLVLFLLTCASTFYTGATGWMPLDHMGVGPSFLSTRGDPYFLLAARLAVLEHWREGLIYMGCVLAILLTHEMGHFVMAVVHRVRASLPYFVPMPFSQIGTMGAVIVQGSNADRRQVFDIGLAGPLAGLVVAIPIVWIGVNHLDLTSSTPQGLRFGLPLFMRLLVEHVHPGQYNPELGIGINQLNAYFMAGWVGLLITGLNMMPVSQLDGGHVIYALFGRAAHWLARLFMLTVFVYMGVMYYLYKAPPTWILMAVLVLMIGTDHPPTRDDSVQLGWFRRLIGFASLLVPVLCFIPNPVY
jgi:membrane-associated protease RseP (regulator of RpoE activity)